eukprot:228146-Prymnesium_polylepis.1
MVRGGALSFERAHRLGLRVEQRRRWRRAARTGTAAAARARRSPDSRRGGRRGGRAMGRSVGGVTGGKAGRAWRLGAAAHPPVCVACA